MYIIDSNILISELLAKYFKDESVKSYLSFYRKIPLMKRVIPDFILNEFELFIIYVVPVKYSISNLEKKQLHDIVAKYLRQISTNCTLISPNQQIMKNSFALYQNQINITDTNHISLTDCLLLSSAVQLQYTILSSDKQLNTYAAELHIPHYEPAV